MTGTGHLWNPRPVHLVAMVIAVSVVLEIPDMVRYLRLLKMSAGRSSRH